MDKSLAKWKSCIIFVLSIRYKIIKLSKMKIILNSIKAFGKSRLGYFYIYKVHKSSLNAVSAPFSKLYIIRVWFVVFSVLK